MRYSRSILNESTGNRQGKTPNTNARIRSLLISKSFLGTRSTITPMNGVNRIPGAMRAVVTSAIAASGCDEIAAASEVSRGGRLGLYDVVVTNQRGERVALMRGRSYTAQGRRTVELPDTPI